MRMMSPGSSVGASGQKEDERRRLTPGRNKKRLSKPNGNESPLLSPLLRDNPETRASGKRDECIRQMETLHLQNAFSFGRYHFDRQLKGCSFLLRFVFCFRFVEDVGLVEEAQKVDKKISKKKYDQGRVVRESFRDKYYGRYCRCAHVIPVND